MTRVQFLIDDSVYEENVEQEFDEDRARSDLCIDAAKFLLCARVDAKITQTALRGKRFDQSTAWRKSRCGEKITESKTERQDRP